VSRDIGCAGRFGFVDTRHFDRRLLNWIGASLIGSLETVEHFTVKRDDYDAKEALAIPDWTRLVGDDGSSSALDAPATEATTAAVAAATTAGGLR